MGLLDRALNMGESKQFRQHEKRVARIGDFEPELELESDEELKERMDGLRQHVRSQTSDDKVVATLDEVLPECFAITREVGRRTMGMRHFDVQMIGGMVLHGGNIAEMRTGEGKTLTGTLAVVLNSLAGKGVHVVTVNDYLAKRDAEWMMPIYEACGVTVGILQNNMDPNDKIDAYACDVTYGTNSEFGFDYLRDNMAQDKVQHGGRLSEDGKPLAMHYYAIVDEVDNILIDEARTPLIISGAPEAAADHYIRFAKLAKVMTSGKSPEGMDPKARKDFVADFDFEFDEKHKTVAVTEQGVQKAEKFLGIDHLYRAENGPLVNHLLQSLKAESLYKRDVDYAVIDDEVKIIDEFTGRILEGRRWSEGLHQAVEAKEGVAIREENQTLATITLQNYFRLYDKLSGMTGTALTEATEFMKIYKIPVVEVPTNQPMVREDHNDQIFKTRDGKWKAVIEEIVGRHQAGQPILVGTVSVETSEMISEALKREGIEHVVLNAKPEHAEREGELIAQAGRKGAVMIATNMAGRGVDIKLGGDPEHLAIGELKKKGITHESEGYEEALQETTEELRPQTKDEAEEVRELGGLFICGTERHESRRIDNQLRGRSGRQGDPGASRFFLSAEDDVIRLFAGDRIYKILDKLGPVDDDGTEVPLEAKMLTKTVENAQKKVEEQNFLIRKRVLEYDDVMNEQRRVVYKYRREILEGRDISETARDEVEGVIDRLVEEYTAGDLLEEWDLDELETQLRLIWPVSVEVGTLAPETVDREKLKDELDDDAMSAYDEREGQLGEELMRYVERSILLQVIDNRWREHLFDMDYLREGIHLRGFAQIDPLVAYKNEGYSMFEELMHSIWEEFSKLIFRAEVEVEGAPSRPAAAAAEPDGLDYSGGTLEAQPSALQQVAAAGGGASAVDVAAAQAAGPGNGGGNGGGAAEVVETVVKDEHDKIGRNDPCWCGSGKKYKKCHGA